ncbi:IS111A/IS1328/IS1533, transposase [Pseudomonas putida S11]|nr:IS111A/IS1328/IS1533, transposase [Pseudomonas putida S11]
MSQKLEPAMKPLIARGKRAKVAAVACMRVLLVRLNAMLRDGTEWKELKPQVPAP